MLKGKKIILGITGSIAAYKAAVLCRRLIRKGALVKVIMTPAAKEFVGEITLSTLSKHPVMSEINSESTWNNHVELGLWADVLLVAPASANTLAKMANGLCDNLLLATYLSAKCPTLVAPAMDLDMWQHTATQNNLLKLQSYGNEIIPVEHGELASGLVGNGRLAEPETIVAYLEKFFDKKKTPAGLAKLKGKTVLINAGPTFEPIDPVRFIGNRSSGKMGIALAEQMATAGASVTLVLGDTPLRPIHPAIKTISAPTASAMLLHMKKHFPKAQITICAAAVADYTPIKVATQKIKKAETDFTLSLSKTTDILATLGALKKKGQRLIGFALETDNALANAKKKLLAKNADLIVLNTLEDKGAGFAHDTNKVTLVTRTKKQKFELKSKSEVAKDILNAIISLK